MQTSIAAEFTVLFLVICIATSACANFLAWLLPSIGICSGAAGDADPRGRSLPSTFPAASCWTQPSLGFTPFVCLFAVIALGGGYGIEAQSSSLLRHCGHHLSGRRCRGRTCTIWPPLVVAFFLSIKRCCWFVYPVDLSLSLFLLLSRCILVYHAMDADAALYLLQLLQDKLHDRLSNLCLVKMESPLSPPDSSWMCRSASSVDEMHSTGST